MTRYHLSTTAVKSHCTEQKTAASSMLRSSAHHKSVTACIDNERLCRVCDFSCDASHPSTADCSVVSSTRHDEASLELCFVVTIP